MSNHPKFSAVQTLIAQQIDIDTVDQLPQEVRKRQVVGHGDYAYVFVKMQMQLASDPSSQVPLVIYHHADWRADSVKGILEPLGLWNPERFGVWVLPVAD